MKNVALILTLIVVPGIEASGKSRKTQENKKRWDREKKRTNRGVNWILKQAAQLQKNRELKRKKRNPHTLDQQNNKKKHPQKNQNLNRWKNGGALDLKKQSKPKNNTLNQGIRRLFTDIGAQGKQDGDLKLFYDPTNKDYVRASDIAVTRGLTKGLWPV